MTTDDRSAGESGTPWTATASYPLRGPDASNGGSPGASLEEERVPAVVNVDNVICERHYS